MQPRGAKLTIMTIPPATLRLWRAIRAKMLAGDDTIEEKLAAGVEMYWHVGLFQWVTLNTEAQVRRRGERTNCSFTEEFRVRVRESLPEATRTQQSCGRRR